MTEIVVRRPARRHEAKLHDFIVGQVSEAASNPSGWWGNADAIFQHVVQNWSASWDLLEEEVTAAQSDASFTAEG